MNCGVYSFGMCPAWVISGNTERCDMSASLACAVAPPRSRSINHRLKAMMLVSDIVLLLFTRIRSVVESVGVGHDVADQPGGRQSVGHLRPQ